MIACVYFVAQRLAQRCAYGFALSLAHTAYCCASDPLLPPQLLSRHSFSYYGIPVIRAYGMSESSGGEQREEARVPYYDAYASRDA